MVKKVGGPKTPGASGTKPVEASRAVGTGKVRDVKDVHSTEAQKGATRARRPTRPMTAAEREHLFRLIHEEADKMFGPNGLPESQRHTVEEAVRKTIDASIVDEED